MLQSPNKIDFCFPGDQADFGDFFSTSRSRTDLTLITFALLCLSKKSCHVRFFDSFMDDVTSNSHSFTRQSQQLRNSRTNEQVRRVIVKTMPTHESQSLYRSIFCIHLNGYLWNESNLLDFLLLDEILLDDESFNFLFLLHRKEQPEMTHTFCVMCTSTPTLRFCFLPFVQNKLRMVKLLCYADSDLIYRKYRPNTGFFF